MADLTQSIAIEPTTRAHVSRGIVYADRGDLGLAIADETQAIKFEPNNSLALALRCRYRALANRDLELALADCDRSLAIDRFAETLVGRGLVYFRLGRDSAAITDLDEVLKVLPGNAEALYVRGLAKHRMGDAPAGDADIAKGLTIDPSTEVKLARYGIARAQGTQ